MLIATLIVTLVDTGTRKGTLERALDYLSKSPYKTPQARVVHLDQGKDYPALLGRRLDGQLRDPCRILCQFRGLTSRHVKGPTATIVTPELWQRRIRLRSVLDGVDRPEVSLCMGTSRRISSIARSVVSRRGFKN